jgi:hypothetical protein
MTTGAVDLFAAREDQCPDDPAKLFPGTRGGGLGDGDTDADGTPDCHDPATSAALTLLVL